MRRLTLQLFGGLRANREGGADVASAGRKAQALLAYLALHLNQDCTRDRLATLLWSDRGEKQARQSLRQAVHFLHKALDDDGNAILVSDGDRLTLAPEAVAVDVRDFERLSAANTREALEQARALYAGDFLEGIDVRSEGFEEWLAAERARLRDLAANVLQRLTQIYMDSGEWDAALGTAQKLLALDPLREEGHRILMRLYEGAGRRTLALRQYRTCEETLRRALNTAPAPETVRLYSEIRARNREMTGDADAGKATAGDEPKLKGREPGRPQHADRKVAGNAVAALSEMATAPRLPAARQPAPWKYAAAAVLVIATIGVGGWRAGLIPGHQATGPSAAALTAPRLSIDAQVWEAIRSSTNPADYQAYLRLFPSGPVANLARERLSALAPSRQPPASAASRILAASAPKPEQNAVATKTVPPPVPAPEQQAMVAPDASKSVTSPALPGAPYDGEWKGVVLGGQTWIFNNYTCGGSCRRIVKMTVAKNAVSGKMETVMGNVQLSGTVTDDGSFTGKLGGAPLWGKFDEDRFKSLIEPSALPRGGFSDGNGGVLILERVK